MQDKEPLRHCIPESGKDMQDHPRHDVSVQAAEALSQTDLCWVLEEE